MIVHVGGDGSHLALVDTGSYTSFVGRNWAEGDLLYKHLVEQANSLHALAWATGFETDWRVEVRPGITLKRGFREFSGNIKSTVGALHLVNYDSLTMAAQFEDHRLPDKETNHYSVPLESGSYAFRVVQLVNPRSSWSESLGDGAAFVLEFEPTTEQSNHFTAVPWIGSV
jgi:hypothetical protein